MSYSISELCVNCHACYDVCPNDAIYKASSQFMINKKSCTECEGDHDDAQCASICPIEGAILQPDGEAANPAGSLTGIPPQKLEAAMAEIQAR